MSFSLPAGFFAYTCGRLVVVEDLHSGTQRHWLGHPQEISTLALNQDGQVHPCPRLGAQCTVERGCSSYAGHIPAYPPFSKGGVSADHCPSGLQILASASCCGNTATRCQIRIWDVPQGLCRHLLSHHDTAVQALAFSPDDEFLVTLGKQRGGRSLGALVAGLCLTSLLSVPRGLC